MSAQIDEWDVTDVSVHASFPIPRLLLSDQFRVWVFGNILLKIMKALKICTLAHIKSWQWTTQAFVRIFTKVLRTPLTKSRTVLFVYSFHLVIKKPERNKLWVALNADGCVVGFCILYFWMNFRMAGLRVSSSSSYEIQKLAVAKNYRCLGISNMLWKELEREGCLLCPDRSTLMKWVMIIGPLQIRLSTISLLSIAESYYVKKGFSLLSHLHLNGYDLDVFEKTVRN